MRSTRLAVGLKGWCAGWLALAMLWSAPAARGYDAKADRERAYTILRDVWQKSAGTGYYARDWAPADLGTVDPDRALQLARKPDGTVPDMVIASVIGALAAHSPERIATWAPAKLPLIHGALEYGYACLALIMASRDMPLSPKRDLYAHAKARLNMATKPTKQDDMLGPYTVVGLAAAARAPEAGTLLLRAIALTESLPGGSRASDEMLEALAEMLGPVDAALALKVADHLPNGRSRERALSRAIVAAAPHDVVGARKLFGRFAQTMDADPNARAIAVRAIVAAIGKKEPAKAQELAESVLGEGRALALAVAAHHQTPKLRGALYRRADRSAQVDKRDNSRLRIDVLAYEDEPVIGRELLEAVEPQATTNGPRRLAEFAFYYARIDRAESKRLIEAELAKPVSPDDRNAWTIPFDLALAMAPIDFDRALDIARSVPGDHTFDVQRKLAQYLLATPAVRRSMEFDRWCASDTWVPGTPTGW